MKNNFKYKAFKTQVSAVSILLMNPFHLYSILPFFINILPQEKGEISLLLVIVLLEDLNGETIREVYGNVVLTQGNVIITCDKAIQYISLNNAELIGNVVVKQDSMTIETPRGYYYGDERKSESNSGVKLDDKKVILTADSGEYFFNDDKAIFRRMLHSMTLLQHLLHDN